VELTTTAKSRSVLNVDASSKLTTENLTKDSTRISFIDGKQGTDGKKSLTTSYTELTTVFNRTKDTEHLGIASIDVDFNTAYAPIINIKFIDVRGSAVFAHGNDSPYSVFFELPYPIFELKIKGYYGKAVKYCLHLTKWNSSFNSDTGNFEISADFIGYTYAMLTDMLLGYLRAITYTARGSVKFEEMKEAIREGGGSQEDLDSFITINELLDRIELLNYSLEEVKSDDEDMVELANNKEVKNALDNIEELVINRINSIKKVEKSQVFDDNKGLFAIRQPTDKRQSDLFIAYQNEIDAKVDLVNSQLSGKLKLDKDDYTTKVKQYSDISYNEILTGDAGVRKTLHVGLNDSQYDEFRQELLGALKGKVNGPEKLTIYKFSRALRKIAVTKKQLEDSEKETKVAVSNKAGEIVKQTLGFKPTIRNMFQIFTTHVEIFLEVLKDVSSEADLDSTGDRAAELAKLDKSSYDVHPEVPRIYPWPLYRKQVDSEGSFEETWLGSEPDIIESRVPELIFVEDLLDAMIKVNTEENERLEALQNADGSGDGYFPINPIDTPMFNNGLSAWTNLETANAGATSTDDVLRLMLIRAFAFFGLNNDTYNLDEISTMGAVEGAAAHRFLLNDDIKDVIANLETTNNDNPLEGQVKTILDKFSKKIPSKDTEPFRFMGTNSSGDTYYNWIETKSGSDWNSMFPFSGKYDRSPFYNGTNGIFDNAPDDTWDVDNEEGFLFAPANNNVPTKGGIFMKIFTESDYNNNNGLVPDFRNTDKFKLNEIKSYVGEEGNFVPLSQLLSVDPNSSSGEEIIGTNIFHGKYQCQEFFRFKLDDNCSPSYHCRSSNKEYLDSVPFFIMDGKVDFYISIGVENTLFNTSLALGHTDDLTGTKLFATPEESPEESLEGANLKSGEVTTGLGNLVRTKGVLAPKHGQNRELWERAKSDSNVWVPDVQFACEMAGNDSYEVAPFSLFGSRLYFEQRRSSNPTAARAYLFLNTIPWNGLTDAGDSLEGIFNRTSNRFGMQNLFGRRPGFINTPKSWVAFIGAILWRYDGKPMTSNGWDGGSGKWDPIIWGQTTKTTPYSEATAGSLSGVRLGNGNSEDVNGGWDNDNCWAPAISTTPYYSTYFWDPFIPLTDNRRKDGTANIWQQYPRRDEFLTSRAGATPFQIAEPFTDTDDRQYKPLSEQLKNLPEQVKEEFKKIFFEFVNGDFTDIKDKLEIFSESMEALNDGSPITSVSVDRDLGRVVNQGQFLTGTNLWKSVFNGITSTTTKQKWGNSDLNNFNVDNLKASYSKIYKANYFTDWPDYSTLGDTAGNLTYEDPIEDMEKCGYDYNVVIKKSSSVQKLLVSIFTEGVVIANVNPHIWRDSTVGQTAAGEVNVSKTNLERYVRSFLSVFKDYNGTDDEFKDAKEEAAKQEIFNTMDDDTIRLNIYRHCKAVYDKWIGGSGTDIMFTCGARPRKDTQIANKRGSELPALIDSFRFVDRAFSDIGDDFLINPLAMTSILTKNYNQSFYDLISRVLADNNFNFIPLPTFIDYEPDNMCEMFESKIFNNELDDNVSGPAFVCVYVGQTSNKLDMGEKSDFPDDGFDMYCDKDNNLIGAPVDFTTEQSTTEHNIPSFMVNYGHENQNIFKNIKLDQSEFAETDESLRITDNIANSASQSNRTFAGQNLWNVYQMRSYSTEIEALGNAQIQPMMYFQLNSIPMFHGSYMIINVSHKLTPNHMSTSFKGVRVRKTKTPLIKEDTLYMSLLGSLTNTDTTGAISGTRAVPNSVALVGNDSESNTDVNYNHIRLKR